MSDDRLDLWARLVTIQMPHPTSGRRASMGIDPETLTRTGPDEWTATAYNAIGPGFGRKGYAVVLDHHGHAAVESCVLPDDLRSARRAEWLRQRSSW